MCRSIKTLRGTPASDDDVHAAALQFIRKVSGYRQPSQRNAEAFERAVAEVASASRRMLAALESGGPKRDAGGSATRAPRARTTARR